jgi:hypothetical protein
MHYILKNALFFDLLFFRKNFYHIKIRFARNSHTTIFDVKMRQMDSSRNLHVKLGKKMKIMKSMKNCFFLSNMGSEAAHK